MITCCLHELQICSSMGNSEIRVDGFFLCMDGQPEFPVELQFCMQLCLHMINTCSVYMLVDKNLCWEQISYFAWSYILKFGIPIVALFLVHQFQKAITYPWSLRAVRFMQRSINLSFKEKTKSCWLIFYDRIWFRHGAWRFNHARTGQINKVWNNETAAVACTQQYVRVIDPCLWWVGFGNILDDDPD